MTIVPFHEQEKHTGSVLVWGSAVCPSCGEKHPECGQGHLSKPWAQPSRCRRCATPLLMPCGDR